MPLMQGIGGALGLLGTVIVLVLMSEVRHSTGEAAWGVEMMFKGKPRFSPVWMWLLVPGLLGLFSGGVIGKGILEGKRVILAALAGAPLGAVVGAAIMLPSAIGQGRAGWHSVILTTYLGALLGGAAAAELTVRWQRRRDRFSD